MSTLTTQNENTEFWTAYEREDLLCETIDQMLKSLDCRETCSIFEPQITKFCMVAEEFSTIYLDTMLVKSDFPVISWKKEDCRSYLMDLSLDGIKFCKPFIEIQNCHHICQIKFQ